MAKEKTDIENLFSTINWGVVSKAKKIINVTENLHQQNSDGDTALMFALNEGQFKIADAIIDKMNEIYQQNNEGNTALIIAIKIGQIELAEKMIEKMDFVDQKNNYGNTAFGFAELQHQGNLVQLIKQKQAQHDSSIPVEEKILSTIFSQLSNKNATEIAQSLKELADLIESEHFTASKATTISKKSLTPFKTLFKQMRK